MFVITENYEILNLSQCLKIVVIRNEIKANTTASYPPESNLIASFDTEVEAGYAYFELFKALKTGKRTWDPDTLKPLSTLWDKVEKHLNNSDVPNGLTTGAHISAFHLDKITITYESQVNNLLRKNTIAKYQKSVAQKLQELLGDTSIDIEWTS